MTTIIKIMFDDTSLSLKTLLNLIKKKKSSKT